VIDCAYFSRAACRSCTWIQTPYPAQLKRKQVQAQARLQDLQPAPIEWQTAVASPVSGMRNKAKMAVGGTIEAPTLGLWELGKEAVDLGDCALYSASLARYFPLIKTFIGRARLSPYDLNQRRGELKFVLLTEAWPDQPVMLRWVLRSTECVDRIVKHLPWLQAQLPDDSVISVNLQPEHKAVLEGDQEMLLTPARWLPVRFNQHQLLFGTRSFLQTNSTVAAALYAQAAEWINHCAPAQVIDLYCGVGAFAYHAAAPGRTVQAIEISSEAIAAAQAARTLNRNPQISFECADADAAAVAADAELVVVNPPRRGLDRRLCSELEQSGIRHLLYSSCNLETLARDSERLQSFVIEKAQVFDMFPHTRHFEVLALLRRA